MAGRPEKSPEFRRSETIHVRFTQDERALIERAAKGQLSDWAREVLLRAAKRAKVSDGG